jgi:hypothetical protein
MHIELALDASQVLPSRLHVRVLKARGNCKELLPELVFTLGITASHLSESLGEKVEHARSGILFC